ncbi:hypothetical protein [Thermococcus sp. MAR1]|uniref:hypothetical protein n=1 Tax=Thermococcus sp. MAR1 TaxID=1638263 RepID=UPI00143B8806|nr:hypothetical protein [Thermococcus sp. MAR1]NJE11146.1 hypothetical protein [Thermococcus sp. MAR1]
MEQGLLWKSVDSLYSWVKKEKYRGWDPYDGLSGNISQRFAHKKLLNIALIQVNLYSPLNLRPLFGIRSGRSNKALALFSRAYLYLYSMTGLEEFKIEAKGLLKQLENQNLSKNKDKFSCASYYFPYIAPKHYLSASLPDIICVTETIKSAITAYEVLGKKHYLNFAIKGLNFLIGDLLEESNGIAYFKYTPEEQGKVVFNVSALALESTARLLKYTLNDELIEIGENIMKLLLEHQREDGAWPYSRYFGSNLYYWQIDYHQGFILDGLIEFLPYLEDDSLKRDCVKAILKGAEFYMRKQFTPEGVSYYRYPVKYPIDIHNQAQGIITFLKLYRVFYESKYLNFAERIAEWTIRNMQDPSGYFYAHRWPGFVNKIPYMRWAQAWMMLALATLVNSKIGDNDESFNDRSN